MGRARKEGAPDGRGGPFATSMFRLVGGCYTMLKRLLTTMFVVGAVLGVTSGANAQYMKITTDNPTDNTKMRPGTATTILTITLDTDHDRNASLQSCNSHTAANCGSTPT